MGSSVLFCSEKNGNWDLCLVRVRVTGMAMGGAHLHGFYSPRNQIDGLAGVLGAGQSPAETPATGPA
jgi:hypothetical protein